MTRKKGPGHPYVLLAPVPDSATGSLGYQVVHRTPLGAVWRSPVMTDFDLALQVRDACVDRSRQATRPWRDT